MNTLAPSHSRHGALLIWIGGVAIALDRLPLTPEQRREVDQRWDGEEESTQPPISTVSPPIP